MVLGRGLLFEELVPLYWLRRPSPFIGRKTNWHYPSSVLMLKSTATDIRLIATAIRLTAMAATATDIRLIATAIRLTTTAATAIRLMAMAPTTGPLLGPAQDGLVAGRDI